MRHRRRWRADLEKDVRLPDALGELPEHRAWRRKDVAVALLRKVRMHVPARGDGAGRRRPTRQCPPRNPDAQQLRADHRRLATILGGFPMSVGRCHEAGG